MKKIIVEDVPPSSANWGNEKRTRVGIYNSKVKHDLFTGDGEPVTRVEVRFKGSAVKVKSFDERWALTLQEQNPFARVHFRALSPGIKIAKPQERIKFDYFCLLVRYHHSFKIACQKFRSYDPAHAYRLEPLIRRFKSVDYQLNEIFQKNLKEFLVGPISEEDQKLFSKSEGEKK